MPRKTKSQRLAEIHADALKEFDDVQEALREVRLQCLQDRRFYSISGAQWEGALEDQFENKPKFEVNKVHLSVIRIINEYRNNRITVDFVSKDGSESDQLADTCDGLYRADEQDSVADEAYDNAFEEGTAGGFGAWRLTTEYEDEEDPEDERQRIRIEPIFDADTSVFFDLQAKRQDKSDAKKCWILTSMTHQAYEDEYDEDPSSWPKDITDQFQHFDWVEPDIVYVAEYYTVEEKRKTFHVYENQMTGEEVRHSEEELENEDDKLMVRLLATGYKKVRSKQVKEKKIHKYIMSGSKILEDCGYIAGKCIPIIPFYGKRWYIDNVERCMGHVRLAKDAQRLKNMQLSKLGEISALSPVEKPILTPEQVAGHQLMWEEDNVNNYPYLLVNPIIDANGQEMITGPIGYTKLPNVPPAMAALLQITEDDMQDLLGNQQDGEAVEGNVSTETMQLVQNRLDMQTFIYMSNFAKAVQRSGQVWLSMAKDVLVEKGRKMKIIGNQGEMSQAELMRAAVDDKGSTIVENDLSEAKFDVWVEVGPSSSTKRSATVRSLINMAGATDDPETKQVLSAMIMMNLEGEGIEDTRSYFRDKLIKMGVVKPTKEEAAELKKEAENQPEDPNSLYLKAAAGAEEARGVEAQADTILKQAKADETRAKTAETLASINFEKIDKMLQLIDKVGPLIEQLGSRVEPPNLPNSEVQE